MPCSRSCVNSTNRSACSFTSVSGKLIPRPARLRSVYHVPCRSRHFRYIIRILGCLKTLRPSCNCNEQFSRVRVNGRNVPHGLSRLVLRKRHHKLHARGRMCWLTDSAKAVYSEAQHNSQPVSQTAIPPNDGIRTLRAQALDSQQVICGFSVLGVSPCVSNQPTRPSTCSTC